MGVGSSAMIQQPSPMQMRKNACKSLAPSISRLFFTRSVNTIASTGDASNALIPQPHWFGPRFEMVFLVLAGTSAMLCHHFLYTRVLEFDSRHECQWIFNLADNDGWSRCIQWEIDPVRRIHWDIICGCHS